MNSLVPWPTTSGKIRIRYSSTRPRSAKAYAALRTTITSRSDLSLSTVSSTSPVTRAEFCHALRSDAA